MEVSEKAKGATTIAKEHYESESAQVFYKQVMDIVEERSAAIEDNMISSPREPSPPEVLDSFDIFVLQYMHHICLSRTRYSRVVISRYCFTLPRVSDTACWRGWYLDALYARPSTWLR